MTDINPRRLWPWIVALIGLPVLYVASFGPACWLASRMDLDPLLLSRVYRPITWGLSPTG